MEGEGNRKGTIKKLIMEVNGKTYPLWGQFVEKKEEFVGGVLEDFGDSIYRRIGFKNSKTKIVDIKLRPNGEDSAFFEVIGKDFSCGFDVEYGGVTTGEEGWITFSGYIGQIFRILKNNTEIPLDDTKYDDEVFSLDTSKKIEQHDIKKWTTEELDEIEHVDFEEEKELSNAEKAILNLVSINWFFDNWHGLNEDEQQKIIDNLEKIIG